MSKIHLRSGSVEPPRKEGVLRVYSMRFCPFARRALLVLKAKNLNFDIVNIHLRDKPEWYLQINPKGQVPTLLDGSKVVVESLDISDYLDEKYHQNQLYSSDPEIKKRHKELIDNIREVVGLYYKCVRNTDEKTPKEWVDAFVAELQKYEDELKKSGTTFFGGDKPGMLDYMIWPWGESCGVLARKLGDPLPFEDSHIPLLRRWREAMFKDPAVDAFKVSTEVSVILAERYKNGGDPEYDALVQQYDL